VAERSAHNRLVAGSNPAEPTVEATFAPYNINPLQKVAGSPDLLQLRELLHILLGSKGRRQLELRQLTNKDLFALYEGELALHHYSKDGLDEAKRVLNHFHRHIGEYPPSPELAKSYLSQFRGRKPATRARYGAILKVFLKWYGEELDIKFKVPKTLPEYVQKSDLEKLQATIASKKSHKKSINRDLLLVDLAIHTGLRRSELAHLTVKDIDTIKRILTVRRGKGSKDRVIPLSNRMAEELGAYIQTIDKDNSVFGLAPATISGKIRSFAKKAGVELHTHSLRDYFATSLSEKGATMREIQSLLGHTNLTNTERYTLHTDAHLREAIGLIDKEEIGGDTVGIQDGGTVVTIKGIYKDKFGRVSTLTPVYFSHFMISNEGKEPAMELEIGLLDSNKKSLLGRRYPVLTVGEKTEWRPDIDMPEGEYYMVCQYRKIVSNGDVSFWNQVWLPFELTKADRPGEAYVATGKLTFQTNIRQDEKIAIS
jgi:integrase/recombinase XerD